MRHVKAKPPLLVLTVLAALLATSSPTHAAQKRFAQKKANQANTDDMWAVNPGPGSLPPGVSHHIYHSRCMNRNVGYCIYLPPGYTRERDRRYPVIYHLHGGGGNETRALYSAQVLHEGILAKRWPEMIVVFPNGGRATMYQDSADGRFMAETTVIQELIPHIDATYRTVAAWQGRCIEGFSMGGRGSTHLAMKYPDLFCSFFNQSGNVYHTSQMTGPDYANKWPTTHLGSDPQRLRDNDPYLSLEKNLAKIKGRMRIQIACGTKDSGHIKTVREYHQALLQIGVPHTYFEVEGIAHNQHQMIDRRKATWFDFHVESLKKAGGLAK